MFTDPKRIKLSDKGHPGTCNVFSYYSVFLPHMKEEVMHWCENASLGCTECKKKLAQGLIDRLEPIRRKRQELLKDRSVVRDIVKEGTKKAFSAAQKTVEEVREVMGL